MSKSSSRRGLWITLISLGAVGAVVAALIIFIDPITRLVAERKFEQVDGMTCQIESADFRLFERKIILYGFHFNPENGGAPEDMLYAERFEIDAKGPMIAKKSTKTHLTLSKVEVYLKKDDDPVKDQSSITKKAREDLKALSRWDTDEVEVEDVQVRYIDEKKGLDIIMKEGEGSISNLASARDEFTRERFNWAVFGILEDQSKVDFSGSAQLGVERPDFAIDGDLTGFPLKSINALIHERIGVSVVDGYAALGVHLDGADGKFKGYLAPRFRHLEFDAELEDSLRKSLVAWGLPIVGTVVEDPVAPKPGNNIQVKGQYGKGRQFALEATKKENSWLQNKVLAVGPDMDGKKNGQ